MVDTTSIQRTACIKLESKDRSETLVRETIKKYRQAANYVVSETWLEDGDEPETLTRTEIHHDTYDAVRDIMDLHANHVQLARNPASEDLIP